MVKKTPLVSVLLPTKNSQRTIRKLLQSLKNQSYKKIEIVMVDNSSTDKTVEIAKEFVKKIYNFGPERSAQRNFAAKKAAGSYYLVPDSDMILAKDIVKECVELVLKKPEIKEVIIPEKTIGKTFWTKVKALERECYLGDESLEAARFFEKKVFWEFGGYDEAITGPEEWDLPQLIAKKYKVGRIKSCILHDEGNSKLTDYWKRKYYYAQSARRYLKKQGKGIIGSSTIYFLRPAFYRNWRRLVRNPFLTVGLIVLLTGEQLAGALGFLKSFWQRALIFLFFSAILVGHD